MDHQEMIQKILQQELGMCHEDGLVGLWNGLESGAEALRQRTIVHPPQLVGKPQEGPEGRGGYAESTLRAP
jgi:hypothetical protein